MKWSDATGWLGDRSNADVISGNDNLKHSLEGWELVAGNHIGAEREKQIIASS